MKNPLRFIWEGCGEDFWTLLGVCIIIGFAGSMTGLVVYIFYKIYEIIVK